METARPWLRTAARLGLAAVRLIAVISAVPLVLFVAGIAPARARGLRIDCGGFSSGGTLSAGRDTAYGLDIARDLGFLALSGLLVWRPSTRFSLDGMLMGAR